MSIEPVAEGVADDRYAAGLLPGHDAVVIVSRRTIPGHVVAALQHRFVVDPLDAVLGPAARGRQLIAADEALDLSDETEFVDHRHLPYHVSHQWRRYGCMYLPS